MNAIEIQTMENSRLLNWVRIYADTSREGAIRWGNDLLSGFGPLKSRPNIRLVTTHDDAVIGTWAGGVYGGDR